jgi:hypothetical protein
MKRHLLGFGVFIILSVCISFFTLADAFFVGAIEARLDLLRGRNRSIQCLDATLSSLKTIEKYDQRLYKEYGIETAHKDACFTHRARACYVIGYNIVQVPHLNAVFGRETFERLNRQIRLERQAELAEEYK